jgi:hypothetical protein
MMRRSGIRGIALAWVLSIVFLAGTVGFPIANGPERAEASALQPLQLIAEQDAIMPGGTVTYHIVYHADIAASGSAKAQVVVPEALEVADAGTAEWDASQRVLTWNFSEVEAGTAAAVQFSLKVDAEAEAGETFAVGAKLILEGTIAVDTPDVTVLVGTETHQPFMQGYPDGTFRPDGSLTRAETAAMIARIKGLKGYEGAAYEDVETLHWAYSYIQQVTAEGYMKGYDNRFRPEDPITKAELVTLLLRLRGVSAVPFPAGYTDVLGHWSEYALGTAQTLGFVAAESDALFTPDQPIERKLAAEWVSVGLQRGPLVDGETQVVQHFPDVEKSHPYFGWIEEASSVAHEAEDRGDGAEYLIRYLPEETRPF